MGPISSPVDVFLYWVSFLIVLGVLIYSIFLANTTNATCKRYDLDINDYENIADFLSSDDGNLLKRNDENNIEVDAIKVQNTFQFGIAIFDTFAYDSDNNTFTVGLTTKADPPYPVYKITGTSNHDDEKGYYMKYDWEKQSER